MNGDVNEQSDNVARIDSSESEHILAAQATNQRRERARVLQYERKPNFAGSSRRVVNPFTRSSFQGTQRKIR
jgi:hypothetical protein